MKASATALYQPYAVLLQSCSCINTTMECWTNLDESCIRPEDIDHINSSWDCEEEKDECNLCFEALEQNYWLGTEAGEIGGYGFHGILHVCLILSKT